MAYANVLLKTVGPVAAGFGLWYLLIDRGNDKIREEFEKSQGKGNARDGSPLVKNTEKELMVKTILGGGASDLKKVREETAKRRQQIAEEYHKLPVDTRDK